MSVSIIFLNFRLSYHRPIKLPEGTSEEKMDEISPMNLNDAKGYSLP